MRGETMKQVCGVCGRMIDAPEQHGIVHRCPQCARVPVWLASVEEDLAAMIRRIEGIRQLLAVKEVSE